MSGAICISTQRDYRPTSSGAALDVSTDRIAFARMASTSLQQPIYASLLRRHSLIRMGNSLQRIIGNRGFDISLNAQGTELPARGRAGIHTRHSNSTNGQLNLDAAHYLERGKMDAPKVTVPSG